MDDRARVAQQLGREPRGAFDVVVRADDGDPIVVRNAPFLDDGTPMPTRYYLVGPDLVVRVSRLEAAGGVRRAEAEIPADQIAAAHERYAAERDTAIEPEHAGPRPSGGVGGTRTGVKCLHAHLAHTLAGGDDPVGRWTLDHLDTDLSATTTDKRDDETADANDDPTPSDSSGHVATATEAHPSPGGLTVRIDDRHVEITVTGGASFTLPIGPLALLDGPLERDDPPAPAQLTNALGFVQDYLDDVIIASPSVAAAPSIIATGPHGLALAQVEIGSIVVPDGYRLARTDADEVFRTLAVEPIDDRRHNPGLGITYVESIVATCCVILGIMRRLDLDEIMIDVSDRAGR